MSELKKYINRDAIRVERVTAFQATADLDATCLKANEIVGPMIGADHMWHDGTTMIVAKKGSYLVVVPGFWIVIDANGSIKLYASEEEFTKRFTSGPITIAA